MKARKKVETRYDLDQELFSRSQIAERVSELAAQISSDYAEDEVINLVPVLTGAMLFCSDLVRQIPNHCRVYPVIVTSYQGMSPGEVDVYIPRIWNLPEKLIIVEDILDTGHTLDLLCSLLLEAPNVKGAEICTLLHKNKVSSDQISAKYVGFHCPADAFVVGYGLDLDGWLRDLPAIYTLKKVKE